MHMRGSGGDGFRLSTDGFRVSTDGFRLGVSSTPSCSSQVCAQDDFESLGDVYIWGELWFDGGAADALIPKALESNIVLDVHQIACGVHHVALVTRQGELFTWGEELGGRLGHGIERNKFTQPHLVELLAVTNIEFVSCGEFHTCALSTSGDLFTWGDGIHYAGLLGHGTEASHCVPKRVAGPIEGLRVISIACGTWHTAFTVANTGRLFTFGDGTFGALGHGDRKSVRRPREVDSLHGLKAIKVACGVWHTAATVEVASYPPSRKLFTWGDGDKYRLGHGSKDSYLVPTCVSNLSDYNFQQIGCGHNLTVALTTSGHVFTMGSTTHGQLGNPQADGKLPCLVQDKLVGEFVEEIACGAHHVAVLTSRSEVYTWGKGENGRLGHGDMEDRKTPTFVEALKDRHVKSVSCGSNFTAAICIHTWVSGADQSLCSGCRQTFGFTKKRHNCYNCGLVHCATCTSKKSVRAALAPTPSKPHRVCDACYNKLKATTATTSALYCTRPSAARRSYETYKDKCHKLKVKTSRILLSPSTQPVKYLEVKNQRHGGKSESISMVRASQVPSFQQLKDIAFPSSFSAFQTPFKDDPVPPPPPLPSTSKPASPYARRPTTPTRSAPPTFSRGIIDSLKKSNELLSQQVAKLQKHLKSLEEKCDFQDEEIEKLHKINREAALFAAEQSSKREEAKKVVKCFTSQLKEVAEKIPPEICEDLKVLQTQALAKLDVSDHQVLESQSSSLANLATRDQNLQIQREVVTLDSVEIDDLSQCPGFKVAEDGSQPPSCKPSASTSTSPGQNVTVQDSNILLSSNVSNNSSRTTQVVRNEALEDNRSSSSSSQANAVNQTRENVGTPSESSTLRREVARQSIEQFEPGVYVTFIQLHNGTRVFKRVRFSKRRFVATQAEEWWRKNRDRVLQNYVQPPINSSTTST